MALGFELNFEGKWNYGPGDRVYGKLARDLPTHRLLSCAL